MSYENIAFLTLGLSLVGFGSWALGWHYGAKSLRNRHKKLIKLMEENNNEMRERNKIAGNNWYDGYAAGESAVLTAFDVFLDKFRE